MSVVCILIHTLLESDNCVWFSKFYEKIDPQFVIQGVIHDLKARIEQLSR